MDLNGDGAMTDQVTQIRGLPERYAGAARDVEVTLYLYPQGTEFLHTVRYIDPEQPTLLSTRMKEVRYSKKVLWLDAWAIAGRSRRPGDPHVLPPRDGRGRIPCQY